MNRLKEVPKSKGEGGGDNRAVTELSSGQITTKNLGYSGCLALKKNLHKKLYTNQNHFLKIQWKIHFLERHFRAKILYSS